MKRYHSSFWYCFSRFKSWPGSSLIPSIRSAFSRHTSREAMYNCLTGSRPAHGLAAVRNKIRTTLQRDSKNSRGGESTRRVLTVRSRAASGRTTISRFELIPMEAAMRRLGFSIIAPGAFLALALAGTPVFARGGGGGGGHGGGGHGGGGGHVGGGGGHVGGGGGYRGGGGGYRGGGGAVYRGGGGGYRASGNMASRAYGAPRLVMRAPSMAGPRMQSFAGARGFQPGRANYGGMAGRSPLGATSSFAGMGNRAGIGNVRSFGNTGLGGSTEASATPGSRASTGSPAIRGSGASTGFSATPGSPASIEPTALIT